MENNRIKKLLDSLVDGMRRNKRTELAGYIGLGAICLLLCLPAIGDGSAGKEDKAAQQQGIEQRLTDALSSVRGAGKVKVMITYTTEKDTEAAAGALVVAQGAADISVRMRLLSAVQAVLGIDASRVEVLDMGASMAEEGK